jgi:hypothetical protein
MNRLLLPLKSLYLPGFLAVVFVLVGCFSSPPQANSSSPVPTAASESESTSKGAVRSDEPGTNADQQSSEIVLVAAEKTAASEKSAKKEPAEYVDKSPPPMLQGWTKPAVAIVLSGDIRGYLEPCGCSSRQSGGFARRADLFEQLRKKGWPVAAFDLGGSLKRSREHDQIKFTKILSGLRQMKYSAMGLAPAELRLGAERLMSWHEPDGDAPGNGLAFVSSNIVFFDNPEQGTPLPYRITVVNGIKIGVTSVIGDFYRDQVIPRGNDQTGQPISVKPPVPALKAAVEKMKADKPDLMVLLSYGKLEETNEFVKQVPDFDVVLTAGGPEEPLERTEQLGKSMVVQVGGKGKHVAVLGFYPKAAPKIKFELIDLDKFRFKNNTAMVQLMQDFQDELKDADLAVNEKAVATASGATYLGAKKCGECHKKAFAKWSTTKHSHAYESLTKGRPDYEGKWVDRVHDVECIACHVTGWDPQEVVPFESGFRSPELTPHLVGQQCENCHGAGSEHVKAELNFKKTLKATDPTLLKWRQKMHLDQTIAQSATGCYKCHDGDNSPKFAGKFQEYFKQIQHIGKD